jgi:peptidoglycan/LPS O-acetylase OafA/YrhL
MFGTFRTFLAVMVVATHLGGIPKIGAYAVFGFYTLSGYLMTLIMQKNYGYTVSGVSRYAANRFLRIFPIYWLSAILSAFLVWTLGRDFTSSYHPAIFLPTNFLELSKNIILFLPPGSTPRLIPPAWALTVELFFYVLIGFGLSKNRRTTLIFLLIGLIYHALALAFNFGWPNRYFTVFAASLPFATGALIFHYKKSILKYINRINRLCNHMFPYLLFILILINGGFGHSTSQSEEFFFYSNYILIAIMVAVLSETKEIPFLSKNIDKKIGDLSYPIYLIHHPVGIIVVALSGAISVKLIRPDPILFFVSVLIIFVLSWCIAAVVERPIESIRAKIKK